MLSTCSEQRQVHQNSLRSGVSFLRVYFSGTLTAMAVGVSLQNCLKLVGNRVPRMSSPGLERWGDHMVRVVLLVQTWLGPSAELAGTGRCAMLSLGVPKPVVTQAG